MDKRYKQQMDHLRTDYKEEKRQERRENKKLGPKYYK